MVNARRRISLTATRRAVQFGTRLLLHSSWGAEAKWLCLPVLNCHSCQLAWVACPIGVLVHYAGLHVFPFRAVGTAGHTRALRDALWAWLLLLLCHTSP